MPLCTPKYVLVGYRSCTFTHVSGISDLENVQLRSVYTWL